MASGYGVSISTKELLVVGGVVVIALLIIVYLIDNAGNVADSTLTGAATGLGNIPGALGVEPANQLYTDLYNWWEGLGQS
jgi:hypothetical protein